MVCRSNIGWIWWQSSTCRLPLQDGKRGEFFFLIFFFLKIAFTGNADFHVSDGGCEQHTAPRTIARATLSQCEANRVPLKNNSLLFSRLSSTLSISR